ncbi:hypothetical protein GSH19_06430 [Lactobacillus sp. S2-2]|uniref:helix-turn-helix domain-containing protein n=1 Tax=Lactobacillus sp. S2-2 TaxID=2692917 RepID=UPI001F18C14F|nr:helix-turn-helix transcriptional regulator [Lactobacillus sp. S2-2]MCF6515779.1 hypothetical protein [Lactobacillus sp. S2-2]
MFNKDIPTKKLGLLVKRKRKSLEMSQAELAKDICTQATISILEKGKDFHSYDIVDSILKKLKISNEEVQELKSPRYGEKRLNDYENDFLKGDFKKANEKLITIKEDKLDSKELIGRLNFYKGIELINSDGNKEDIICIFQNIINDYSDDLDWIYTAWSYVGLSYTYMENEWYKRSIGYVPIIKEYLYNVVKAFEHNQKEQFKSIRFAASICYLFYDLEQYEALEEVTDSLITVLKKNYCTYYLNKFYYFKSEVELLKGNQESNLKYLKISNQFNCFHENDEFLLPSFLIKKSEEKNR